MNNSEYIKNLSEIRVAINTLCDNLGATYSTRPGILELVLNDALNGDLTGDQVTLYHKFITVKDWTR